MALGGPSALCRRITRLQSYTLPLLSAVATVPATVAASNIYIYIGDGECSGGGGREGAGVEQLIY